MINLSFRVGDKVSVTVPSLFKGEETFIGTIVKLNDGKGRVLVDFGKRRRTSNAVVLQPIPASLLKKE
jgi:hypothetical protein